MIDFGLGKLMREWSELRKFRSLPASDRSIVFYAENGDSWLHFAPIVRELTESMGRKICYLTSCDQDPVLTLNNPNIRAFYIGLGAIRTVAFMSLRADVMVMTMPDLETFHIKRSKSQSVHYVYVFHSMVSTHMIYRAGAFDNYDTVLCVGPHHVREIQETQALGNLRKKRLVECGYGRLDEMLRTRKCNTIADSRNERRVLVAPSWGPDCLLETRGEQLTRVLLESGYQVTVRPHPQTVSKSPLAVKRQQEAFGGNPSFQLETDITSSASLERADVMISDWSGAALEFAFGYEKPVLFVDVPRKVNNPDYENIPVEPLEVSIREEIGDIVSANNLREIPQRIEKLCGNVERTRERIVAARNHYCFNIGESGRVGAECIAGISDGTFNEKVGSHDTVELAGV